MIRNLWQRHRIALTIFVLACLVALFFSVRLVVMTIYWSDPSRRDAPMEPWMTPGYVARSWDVPRSVLIDTLGPVAEERRRITLEEIAQAQGREVSDVVSELEEAIRAFRSSEQP